MAAGAHVRIFFDTPENCGLEAGDVQISDRRQRQHRIDRLQPGRQHIRRARPLRARLAGRSRRRSSSTATPTPNELMLYAPQQRHRHRRQRHLDRHDRRQVAATCTAPRRIESDPGYRRPTSTRRASGNAPTTSSAPAPPRRRPTRTAEPHADPHDARPSALSRRSSFGSNCRARLSERMREKLNNNPLVQVAVVAVLLLGAGFFVLSSMGGGGEEEARIEAVTSTVKTAVANAESRLEPAASVSQRPGVGQPRLHRDAAPAAPRGLRLAGERDARPALRPRRWHRRPAGRRRRTSRLASLPSVATFVVPANRISRYAAITEGVGVDRVPALVVVRPKHLERSRADRVGELRLPERRRASCRTSSTPDTRVAPSTTTPEGMEPGTSRVTCGQVPDSGDSTAPVLEPEESRHPGPDPAAASAAAPAASSPTSWSTSASSPTRSRDRRSTRPAPPGGLPSSSCSSRVRSPPTSSPRAVAERYGLDHIDLSVYQVDMAAANLISVNTARRYRALPVGFVDQADAAGRDGRPDQRPRRRRHPDRHRRSTAASRSRPRKTSRR